jgi:hypothetical protein
MFKLSLLGCASAANPHSTARAKKAFFILRILK